MPTGDQAPFMIVIALIVCTGAVLILRPLAQALARRLEGRSREPGEIGERIAELEHRLAEVEHDRGRVDEVEERLDFAERLLSQGREADRVSPGTP